MKKIRIIIPALAVMALSMGAAVTSTVAWFTANRTAKVASSGITAVNVLGDLNVTVTAGVGTETATSDNTGRTYSIQHKAMTDGSVDMASGTIYKADVDTLNSEGVATAFIAQEQTAEKFHATKFQLTFTQSAYTEDEYLYFDKLNSTAEKATTEKATNIQKSLRVGLKVNSSSADIGEEKTNDGWFVYAPFDNSFAASNPSYTYVSGVSTTAQYVTKNIVTGNADVHTTYGELAKFTAASQNCVVDVFTWFEGTDANCKTAEITTDAFTLGLAFKLSTEKPSTK